MTKEELVRQAEKCIPYNITTIKEEKAFIEGFVTCAERMQDTNEGKALLYAVNKTAERTKKEILRKAQKWLMKYFVEDHYGMSPSGFGVFFQMFEQAMED